MRLYKYDNTTLEFKKVNYVILLLKILAPFFIVTIFSSVVLPPNKLRNISTEEKLIIISEASKFTEEKLIKEIERLNFRFPHIVLAQAQIESGNFKSTIFQENHNMFGMREAQVRANLARGTRRKHAFYDTWKESLYDYALYYSTYLSKLRTEDQYFDYLGQSYAEDPNYVKKVKIQANNNKKLFN